MSCYRSLLFVTLFVLTACTAQTTPNKSTNASVEVGVSTLGLMVEPTWPTGPNSAVRLPLAFGKLEADRTIDGIDYNVSADLGGAGVLADYYPGGGAFRVSGGLFKSSLGIDGRATGEVEVGANLYTGVDMVVSGSPDTSISPMVSVGFEAQVGAGWGISADLGLVYTGGFTVTAEDRSGIVSQADLDAEVGAINDDAADLNILPFAKIGATYRW